MWTGGPLLERKCGKSMSAQSGISILLKTNEGEEVEKSGGRPSTERFNKAAGHLDSRDKFTSLPLEAGGERYHFRTGYGKGMSPYFVGKE